MKQIVRVSVSNANGGYSAKQLLRFYDKLRKRSAHPNFDSLSHPAPAQRLPVCVRWWRNSSFGTVETARVKI